MKLMRVGSPEFNEACEADQRENPKQGEKEAYREGYLQAMADMEKLKRMGFVREQERINMMEDHLGFTLKAWMLDKTANSIYRAPSVWNGSTWRDIRRQVLERDGEVCAFCYSTENLAIDHIHPVRFGGLPRLNNLRVLCKSCNSTRNGEG